MPYNKKIVKELGKFLTSVPAKNSFKGVILPDGKFISCIHHLWLAEEIINYLGISDKITNQKLRSYSANYLFEFIKEYFSIVRIYRGNHGVGDVELDVHVYGEITLEQFQQIKKFFVSSEKFYWDIKEKHGEGFESFVEEILPQID
jgi:hypothetical protein